jgi:hypothetical protein
MHRHELSDEQWALIADLFPSNPGKDGGQWKDHRTILTGRKLAGDKGYKLPHGSPAAAPPWNSGR